MGNMMVTPFAVLVLAEPVKILNADELCHVSLCPAPYFACLTVKTFFFLASWERWTATFPTRARPVSLVPTA